jgi:hypothetical protein
MALLPARSQNDATLNPGCFAAGGEATTGLVVIDVMIVGVVFLSFVSDGLLRLEGYVRDQSLVV